MNEKTKLFFEQNSIYWNSLFKNNKSNTVWQRILIAEKIVANKKNGTLLDIGCGTGQFLEMMLKKGWNCIGIDIAENMIAVSKKNTSKNKKNLRLFKGSIFDKDIKKKISNYKFDAIVALGLIEYFPLSSINSFLKLLNKLSANNNKIILGSRNRLFNLYSYNEFTEYEEKIGNINKMHNEVKKIFSCSNQNELIKELSNFRVLKKYPSFLPNTSPVNIDLRLQFTPADLIQRCLKAGLKVYKLWVVNYHPFSVKISNLKNYQDLKNLVNEKIPIQDLKKKELLPNSSTFIIECGV